MEVVVVVAATLLLLLLRPQLPLPPAAAVAADYYTVIITDGGRLHLHPRLTSVTLDWWNQTQLIEWSHNANVLNLNLSDPTLITHASLLAGGILRIGGSPVDSVVYPDFSGHCPLRNGRAKPTEPDYHCSQVGSYDFVQACFTHQRYLDLLKFAKQTGLRVLLGVNACFGRGSSDTAMDFSNVQALLSFTANEVPDDLRPSIYGFEFGNEINGKVTGHQYGRDIATLRDIVQKEFSKWSKIPLIAGPAAVPSQDWTMAMIETQNASIDIFTYHSYPFNPCWSKYPPTFPPENWNLVIDPECLDASAAQAHTYQELNFLPQLAFGAEIWAGETAIHTNAGSPINADNTFLSSFFYIDQLGSLSTEGIAVVARQCLTGGPYGLLNRTSHQAHPDLWQAVFLHHLAAGYSLSVSVAVVMDTSSRSIDSSAAVRAVRAYGHCASAAAGGGRLLEVSNLATNVSAHVTIVNELAVPSVDMSVWIFTGSVHDPNQSVKVNGQEWAPTNDWLSKHKDFPLPIAQKVPCCTAELPPASIAFIVISGVSCG